MRAVRNIWLEVVSTWRSTGWALAVVLAVVVWALKAQQPPFADRPGGPAFFWPAAQAALALSMFCVPLVWAISRPVTESWKTQWTRSTWRVLLLDWAGVVGFGCLLLAITVGVIITVSSIYDAGVAASFWAPLARLSLGGVAVLLPMAALGPGLSVTLGARPVRAVLVWMLVLAGSLGLLGGVGVPIPLVTFLGFSSTEGSGIGTILLHLCETTFAGLLLSNGLAELTK